MLHSLRNSVAFAVAGGLLPVLLFAIASYSGLGSVAYWAKQQLAMFAPFTPLLLVPESNVVPALFLVAIANVVLYAIVGFVAFKTANNPIIYYGVLVLVLLMMLSVTDEWRLYRWIATDDQTVAAKSLLEILRALRWQYFVVAAGIATSAFMFLRPRLSGGSEKQQSIIEGS